MQITEELSRVLSKHNYKNIENINRKEVITKSIESKQEILKSAEGSYKIQIQHEIDILANTLYCQEIVAIFRDDKEKTLDCERCRTRTQILIKLTDKDKQRVCENCIDIQLNLKQEQEKPLINNDINTEGNKQAKVQRKKRSNIDND